MRRHAFPLLLLIALLTSPAFATEPQPAVISANDNRTAAGTLSNGVLQLHLELRAARWYAESGPPDGVYKDAYAFAEPGHAPQCPGPLLRVTQGTAIHVTLHNLLPSAAKVYGLHSYPGDANSFVQLAAGATQDVQFDAGLPGTHLYWATTTNAHFDRDDERQGEETLLSGAFVVDPAGARPDDRIFVIDSYSKVDFATGGGAIIFGINGKGWPASRTLALQGRRRGPLADHQRHLHGARHSPTWEPAVR